MLLIHVDTNDTARSDPEQISCDSRALGTSMKGPGCRWLVVSILLVEEKDAGRAMHILERKAWV